MKVSSPQNINQNKINSDFFKIYHQNIRSLRRKTQELLSHVYPDLPHVIYLMGHHLNILEKNYINIESYTIGAEFCRVYYERGGVIIYIHNSLKYRNIDLGEYCEEKYIEISVVKLNIKHLSMCIITIYRDPSGNFTYFL